MKGFKPQKGIINTAAMLVAGGAGAGLVTNLAKKVAPVSVQNYVAAAPVVLGVLLSGNKKMEKVAFGLIAVGGTKLLGQFIPAINGLEDMDLSGIFGAGPLNGPLNDFVIPGTDDDYDDEY